MVREVHLHGANGCYEVPGEHGGEVDGVQTDVPLLEVRVDPGLGAGEGVAGELRDGAVGMRAGVGTQGT